MTYTPNLTRSSVVPQTIASETAQNTNWKNHSVSTRDRALGDVDEREVRARVGAGQEEAAGADDLVALAEREGEADGVEAERGDREVDQDLRDHRAGVLAAREADLQEGEARLHEHHEDAGDQHPDGVDPDLERQLAGVGQVQGPAVRERRRGYSQCGEQPGPHTGRPTGPAHRSSSVKQHRDRVSGEDLPPSLSPCRRFPCRTSPCGRGRLYDLSDEHRDVVAHARPRPSQSRARGSARRSPRRSARAPRRAARRRRRWSACASARPPR